MECYYSIRMFIDNYPAAINCNDTMAMADEISALLGCEYDWLGYSLLHPDYDYKDLGIKMQNSPKNRKHFVRLSSSQKSSAGEEGV